MTIAHYHLPGLFEFYELYCRFLPLYRNHPEYFYDWCDIGSIYGAPADCLWGGGRVGSGEASARDVLALMRDYGISPRLTFSNSLLRAEHLRDARCNALCQMLNDGGNGGVILHSDLLLRYLQKTYPNLYFVSSTTKVLTSFPDLQTELERAEFRYVVPDFRLNHALEKLNALPQGQKDKVEFLCNECCYFGCRDRRACYEAVSRKNLGEGGDEHRCHAPDAQGGYRFTKAMENPGFIGVEDIQQTYLPMGFENFKIEGRELGSALVLESSRWHQGVVGIVASRLSEKYSRPSFMIHLNGSTGKGSCRSWGGFNLFAALENCKDLLLGFGGHELAAGFTIDRDNIPAFRDRMNEYARSYCNGRPPEPALEVDVAIAYPAAVTLEELEALSALEPYGSGNARPVFCLLGATLLRTQNVGQNRHLKLRLGKGCAQFDGIFFSTVAERCGCAVGDRVDAAFYLQINEFRGSRTVQLQMVDIRPSLCASGREQEALTLARHIAGGGVPPLRDARRALPTRQQFAAAWRFLERAVPEEGLTADTLPLLRHMASELGGVEPFLRAAVCAAVFRERGLLDWQETEHTITLHLHRGCRVSLEHSPLMAALAYHDSEKGGGAQ